MGGARDFAETLAANLRAVTRLARGLEGGTGEHIVDQRSFDGRRLGDAVDRRAEEFFAADRGARERRIGAGGQVNAVGFSKPGQRCLAVQRQSGAVRMREAAGLLQVVEG